MKERLKKLLEYQKLSVYKFEIKISVGEGTIRGFLADKNGLRVDTLSKISVVFPEINLDWLITGRGSMFISEKQPVQPDIPSVAPELPPPQPSGDNINAVIDLLQASISEKDRQITEKDHQITEKDRQIAEKDRQIGSLLSIIQGVTAPPKPPENP